MQNLNIAIADAQYLTRKGLRALLSSRTHYQIVAEVTDEAALMRALDSIFVDILILDYNKPRHFDTSTVLKIRNSFPGIQIMVISADENRERIFDIISSGVNCFLTKECDETEILDAIAAAYKRNKFFCGKVLDFILQKTFSNDADCDPIPLSLRECEIVELSAKGRIAKEIAVTLGIKTNTVYTHKKRIMKKLGLKHSSELVLYAVDKGLVSTTALPKIR